LLQTADVARFAGVDWRGDSTLQRHVAEEIKWRFHGDQSFI